MRRKAKTTTGPYLVHLKLLRDQVPSFDQFPYTLPALRDLDVLPFHPKVTFLVGENGSGKSTLLEALAAAVGLNPEGGSRNFNFATRASHSDLHACLRVAETVSRARDSFFLRAETFYNVATEIESLDDDGKLREVYGGQPLHERSHGESFFALFRHRFRGDGLYLMDEPEAALSPKRQMELLYVLHDYCRRGAQFVIATHSPIVMAYPDALIYHLSDKGIREVAYQDTEHYLVTRGFLANPQRSIRELLSENAADDPPSD